MSTFANGEGSDELLTEREKTYVNDPPRSFAHYAPGPSPAVHPVYSEDASGNPIYDWTIPDRIFDAIVQRGSKLLVTLGRMPEALSVPPAGPDSKFGEPYPTKNYAKWAELVYQFGKHCAERYGVDEAESWYWQLWNEPDLDPRFTPLNGPISADLYCKLWDYTADALKRALPRARLGGPVTCNFLQPAPRLTFSAEFMEQFLNHCLDGTNAVTGKKGAPLDFVDYHAKGNPRFVDGHVQMDVGRHLTRIGLPLKILASNPRFRNLPVLNSESDPEGCNVCPASSNPQDGYRNSELYPCYNAVVLNNTYKLVDRYKTDLRGLVALTFQQSASAAYFEGFRTLTTHGIGKPVLNFFRMAGMMRGDRLKVESSGALGLDEILQHNVRGKPDIDAMAARSDNSITIMAWNYHDDDLSGPDAPIQMTVDGIPTGVKAARLNHYRVDQTHSNSYTVWKEMGSPQDPTPSQYARMEAAGELELLESPRWVHNEKGKVEISFTLPRHGLSLLQISW